jgi:hypothetical protein
MKVYSRGENPKLYATCREETHNDDGSLSDGSLANVATSMQVIIMGPDKQVVQALDDATCSATGKYYYAGYQIATNALTGDYTYEFVATDGSAQVTKKQGTFNVVEHIE